MQLQFNKSELRFLDTAAQGVKSTEVTQEVRLSDGMPDIGRVLTTWGQVVLRSKEWQDDTVTITGGIKTWTLYAPEDGTEPRSVESWIPFQLRWETDRTGQEGPVLVQPLLRFVDSRGISARKMMVRGGIAAMGKAMYPKETDIYAPMELPEDVEILRNSYPVRIPVEAGEKTFLLDEELALPDSVQAEKLLGCTVTPEISECRVLPDKLVFKGVAHVHLVCRDQAGGVRSIDRELPLSQFSELEGNYDTDGSAELSVAVTSLDTDMAEPGKLLIKCGMVVQYLIDRRTVLDLVQDAYSPMRQVELIRVPLELPTVLDDRRDSITAEQTVSGQSGQVVDAVFLPDFPKQRQVDGGTELELHGLFRTLVYGEDNVLQGINARWEGKQTLPSAENVRLNVSAHPMGQVHAMPGMDGMTLSGQLQMRLITDSAEAIPMITGLELGEIREAEEGRPSVILRISGMESLWELAKQCNSTVDAICMANGLEGEPVRDRMLLIPVK